MRIKMYLNISAELIMEVIKTAIEGVLIIEPRIFEDARGYFFESFSQREFDENSDRTVPCHFVRVLT